LFSRNRPASGSDSTDGTDEPEDNDKTGSVTVSEVGGEKKRGRKARKQTGTDRPFSCPYCKSRFSRRYHLKRHLSAIHRKKQLPRAALLATEKQPKDKCPYCGQLRARYKMEAHKRCCPSRDTCEEGRAEESLVRYMRVNPEGGYLTDSTVRSYSREVERLVDWCRDPEGGNNPDLSLASLARVASSTGRNRDFDYPPPASEILADIPSAHIGVQLNCAYLKLTGWLLHLLSLARSKRSITNGEYVTRSGIIGGERERAKPLRNGLRKRQRWQRRTERSRRSAEGLHPRTPDENTVNGLIETYRGSSTRAELLGLLSDLPTMDLDDPRRTFALQDGTPALGRPQLLRDFMTLELLHPQGVRPDIIRMSTLGHFLARRLVGDGAADGERTYFWNVPVHKTSDKYGDETVIASEQQVAAIEGFVESIRPALLESARVPVQPLSPQDLGAPLFPANGGAHLQTLQAAVEVFFLVADPPAREPGVRPYVFRRLMASFALQSEDPAVRRDIATAMCHSETVANRCYRPTDARACLKTKIAKAFVNRMAAARDSAAPSGVNSDRAVQGFVPVPQSADLPGTTPRPLGARLRLLSKEATSSHLSALQGTSGLGGQPSSAQSEVKPEDQPSNPLPAGPGAIPNLVQVSPVLPGTTTSGSTSRR
jgi:hypothetical protein